MKAEDLKIKGVKSHFTGQEVLFNVESLKEHYDGVEIHESDLISIESVDYVKAGDVNFDSATEKEVIEEIEITGVNEDFPIWINPNKEETTSESDETVIDDDFIESTPDEASAPEQVVVDEPKAKKK